MVVDNAVISKSLSNFVEYCHSYGANCVQRAENEILPHHKGSQTLEVTEYENISPQQNPEQKRSQLRDLNTTKRTAKKKTSLRVKLTAYIIRVSIEFN